MSFTEILSEQSESKDLVQSAKYLSATLEINKEQGGQS